MKKPIQILSVTILIILFSSWVTYAVQYQPEKTTKQHKPHQYQPTKTISGYGYAIDGDSLMLNGKKDEIRLVGIDAPEFRQTCFDEKQKEYPCGKISYYFMKKLVKNKKITCQYSEKDIYHRYLGICSFDKTNVNNESLKNGMSIIYNLQTASQELKDLELQAKANKVGVWQGPFLEPKEYRRKNKSK